MTFITISAITGAGVVTGLLFAFSNFVMRALAMLPARHGMSAMQHINTKIINPTFVAIFLGTPILCIWIAACAFMSTESPGRLFLMLGSIAYLAGPFGITMLFNVPLNNRLAAVDPEDADSIWADYQARWQRWNHVRTYIGVLSVILLSTGLAERSG